MRLDKFISKATELSRKESKKILHASEITVNDEVVKDPGLHVDIINDEVLWAGEPLSVATGNRYILLHKPEGFECTLKAKEYPIVTELIAVPELGSLRIAGRLDVDTTGALLLSDDGGWLHRVTSPKHEHAKVYELTLADPMNEEEQARAIKKVGEGILLEGDYEPTKPATLEFIDETHARLTLEQGKYHQVKRMMGYFGNKVVALHRASIGHINLDGLEKGDSRFLTPEEVAKF
ncbi:MULTISPECIES: pseudouridine synthase [Psychrobacter]|jgi:16S rRNA pseudouridine516 synthase|uniref:Pseudouridine synthase n=1 Tax=Psychrobacter pacificensis TaxID=112002 RepID=A0A1G7AGZ8_9GAMM|nr:MULTISPECIES: 16S rRNA pseudouridine(516) synthase [Psychrobacter]GLR29189.1 pseudouridine synthase [Psychrobacter pacificensis]SDE14101.1 ribosomal small subunit pseudouridine synthase A [Psychrobacter pacificensis]HBD03790.1 16S rRNA pseudouridine(516) synthase [Psychrobacter sp.]|tara:strand:+ start:22434 stop:23138 length:705 start_codon:yes stop_codon:yes gene_type:complete